MKRRKFIQLTGGTVLMGSTFPLILQSCKDDLDGMMRPRVAPRVEDGPFNVELPRLPSLPATNASLTAQHTTATVFKNKTSSVLSYHAGDLLGPTLRAHRGETVQVSFQNQLSEPSNIHWHGLITPAEMDGHPTDIAPAGGSLNYTFPIVQRAGTYWYHPHPDLLTAKQTYRGLAGFFIVSDNEEQAIGLPSGEFELPLVIQDKQADVAGDFPYNPSSIDLMNGMMGERILVNGIHSPLAEVLPRTYRLRVLNGSNARIYNIALSNSANFTIIGTDGGLLAAPETQQTILLAPGERVDLLVSFAGMAAGTELYLHSKAFPGSEYQGKQDFNVLKFKVISGQTDNFPIPALLDPPVVINESEATNTRFFDISNDGGHGGHGGHGGGSISHNINEKVYKHDRIDEVIDFGATEIWTFDNTNGVDPHPMHLHGALFQILDRTGGRAQVFPHEKGWKDTVLVMPGEKVRIIARFEQYKGIFVFHCHNLEHEDTGMMLQMEIK